MSLNKQPISKPFKNSSGLIELHHCFLTIQGEGPFAGTPAVFVRLYGCNLQCPFCDTDYTSECLKVTPEYISTQVKGLMPKPGLVVISGGEPFRQNLTPVVALLIDSGFEVQIETNGTLPPSPDFPRGATIVCSPKTGTINKALAPRIDALKYVVHADYLDPSDGLPIMALGHTAKPTTAKPPTGFTGDVFVQPIDVDNPVENVRHLDAAIRSCMTFGYRLCIQVHKIINME